MKKNKKSVVTEPVVAPEAQPAATPTTTAFPLSDLAPSEELQIYYNDAYMREKQRFNDMFGIIETSEPVKTSVQPDPTPVEQASASEEEYVPLAEYEKLRRKKSRMKFGLAITITLAVIFAIVIVTNTLLF
ncbi:MAG: hypothetical protein IJ735_05725 [Clostridia bacterium]|nr:hypothetical protein [Clostridia bacterium]